MNLGEGLSGKKAIVGHGVEDAVWPSSITSMTLVRPASAPMGDDVSAGPGKSTVEKGAARWGPRCLSAATGTIPVSTAATPM